MAVSLLYVREKYSLSSSMVRYETTGMIFPSSARSRTVRELDSGLSLPKMKTFESRLEELPCRIYHPLFV